MVVYSDGTISWIPLGLFISSCSIDITVWHDQISQETTTIYTLSCQATVTFQYLPLQWFPFDDQICKMKFGSWSYDKAAINLTRLWDEIDISGYSVSGEWKLIGRTLPAKLTSLLILSI